MHGQPWTAPDLAYLRKHYADGETLKIADHLQRTTRAVFQKARDLGVSKSAEFFKSVVSGGLQKGNRSLGNQFTKGFTPWNAGKKGWVAKGTEATRFQSGHKPKQTMDIGTYRINKDGLLQKKISHDPGGPHKRWRSMSELAWTDANGPLPKGHIVVFRPGKRSTVLAEITLDAVECISRAENLQRNHPKNRCPEYAKLCQLKGAINRQVNRINKESKPS